MAEVRRSAKNRAEKYLWKGRVWLSSSWFHAHYICSGLKFDEYSLFPTMNVSVVLCIIVCQLVWLYCVYTKYLYLPMHVSLTLGVTLRIYVEPKYRQA